MEGMAAIIALLGLNVIISGAVWFRLGNLTARVEHVEQRDKGFA